MKNVAFNILIFLLLVLGAASCNSDDTCRKNRKVELGMSFYLDTIQNITGRLVVQKLNIDSLWLQGIGSDSVLYENSKSVGSVKLPLNSFAEESRFRVVFNTSVDTIIIKHKNINEFLSLECGYVRTHTIDTIFATQNFIDSVSVVNEIVNTQHVENIQIHHNK